MLPNVKTFDTRGATVAEVPVPMIFCTLFNWLYLPQGIALYRSLARTVNGEFVLYVLCMDEYSLGALRALGFPNLRPISLAEIENDALRAVRETRTVGEYCWTCTTPLLRHVMEQSPPGAVVSYVDADLRFFSDPSAILSEMGEGDIFIHEHDFAPEHADLRKTSGRFNVGLVAFRNNAEGHACLEKWYAQCLDECVMDPAAGKCGDQNYLDEWPDLYPGLVVSTHPGIGLAPWNVTKHRISKVEGLPMVDDRRVVFYHYHSLSMLRPRFGFKPTAIVSGNYLLGSDVIESIYEPYVRELWNIARRLERIGYGVASAVSTVPYVYRGVFKKQIMFQFFGRAVSPARNARLLSLFYGIDAAREMQ